MEIHCMNPGVYKVHGVCIRFTSNGRIAIVESSRATVPLEYVYYSAVCIERLRLTASAPLDCSHRLSSQTTVQSLCVQINVFSSETFSLSRRGQKPGNRTNVNGKIKENIIIFFKHPGASF